MVLNRRLPRITARVFLSSVPSGDCSLAGRGDTPNTRRNVPGSRLFNQICGHARAETNIAGLLGTTQSGLPDAASGSLND
jgi:hypothetical protein